MALGWKAGAPKLRGIVPVVDVVETGLLVKVLAGKPQVADARRTAQSRTYGDDRARR